jgi:hypothetical protein
VNKSRPDSTAVKRTTAGPNAPGTIVMNDASYITREDDDVQPCVQPNPQASGCARVRGWREQFTKNRQFPQQLSAVTLHSRCDEKDPEGNHQWWCSAQVLKSRKCCTCNAPTAARAIHTCCISGVGGVSCCRQHIGNTHTKCRADTRTQRAPGTSCCKVQSILHCRRRQKAHGGTHESRQLGSRRRGEDAKMKPSPLHAPIDVGDALEK